MTNIDFAALPDAEAARLMAERDGFIFFDMLDSKGNIQKAIKPRQQSEIWVALATDEELNHWVLHQRRYTTSLDAAVAWLGRMGLMWSRVGGNKPYVAVYRETPDPNTQYCNESPTCPTARALCNAGWLAVQAREAANG